jgi:hypothetical protein
MRPFIRTVSTIIAALILTACNKGQESNNTSNTSSENNTSTIRAGLPIATNGGYELAEVLAWAMEDKTKDNNQSTLSSVQDYNKFKGVISDIHRSSDGDADYEGSIILFADGKQSITENIEDSYSWNVEINGPSVGADTLVFYSSRSVSTDLGPAYLRKNKFDLIALSCFSYGNTPNNASVLYLAQYPGKKPTLISYNVTTGSMGQSVWYSVYFGQIDWKSVPGATEVDYKNDKNRFGDCPYESLR